MRRPSEVFSLRPLRCSFAHFALKDLDRKGGKVLAKCAKIGLLLAVSWTSGPPCVAENGVREEQIDHIFEALKSPQAPGAAVLVIRDGVAVFTRGYGVADLHSLRIIDAHTNFRLASCTKQFTAMAVMLLAADGKLSLDDDIRKHLPELPDYGHHRPPMPRRAPMRNRLHRGRGHLARAGSARHHSRAVHPWRSNAEAVRSAGAPGRSGARPAHARNPGYFRPRRRQLRVHLLRRQRRLSPGGLERLS